MVQIRKCQWEFRPEPSSGTADVVDMGTRPFGGKQPRSARGSQWVAAAALPACGPTKKQGALGRSDRPRSMHRLRKRLYGMAVELQYLWDSPRL
jgi:hypothetical protein